MFFCFINSLLRCMFYLRFIFEFWTLIYYDVRNFKHLYQVLATVAPHQKHLQSTQTSPAPSLCRVYMWKIQTFSLKTIRVFINIFSGRTFRYSVLKNVNAYMKLLWTTKHFLQGVFQHHVDRIDTSVCIDNKFGSIISNEK